MTKSSTRQISQRTRSFASPTTTTDMKTTKTLVLQSSDSTKQPYNVIFPSFGYQSHGTETYASKFSLSCIVDATMSKETWTTIELLYLQLQIHYESMLSTE